MMINKKIFLSIFFLLLGICQNMLFGMEAATEVSLETIYEDTKKEAFLWITATVIDLINKQKDEAKRKAKEEEIKYIMQYYNGDSLEQATDRYSSYCKAHNRDIIEWRLQTDGNVFARSRHKLLSEDQFLTDDSTYNISNRYSNVFNEDHPLTAFIKEAINTNQSIEEIVSLDQKYKEKENQTDDMSFLLEFIPNDEIYKKYLVIKQKEELEKKNKEKDGIHSRIRKETAQHNKQQNKKANQALAKSQAAQQNVTTIAQQLQFLYVQKESQNSTPNDIDIQIHNKKQELADAQKERNLSERQIVVYNPLSNYLALQNTPILQEAVATRNVPTLKEAIRFQINEFNNTINAAKEYFAQDIVKNTMSKLFSQKNLTKISVFIDKPIRGIDCIITDNFIKAIDACIEDEAREMAVAQLLTERKIEEAQKLNNLKETLLINFGILQRTNLKESQLVMLVEESNEILTKFSSQDRINTETNVAEQAQRLEKINFDPLITATVESTITRHHIEEGPVADQHGAIWRVSKIDQTKDTILNKMTPEKKSEIATKHKDKLIAKLIDQNIERKIEEQKSTILNLWSFLANMHNSNWFETIVNCFKSKDNNGSWKELEKFHTQEVSRLLHPDTANHEYLTPNNFAIEPRENPLEPLIIQAQQISIVSGIGMTEYALNYVCPALFYPMTKDIHKETKKCITQLALGKQRMQQIIRQCEQFVK